MKIKKILKAVLFLIFFAIAAYSALQLFGIYTEYEEGTDLYDELANQYVTVTAGRSTALDETGDAGPHVEEAEIVEEFPVVDFAALKTACEDVVAWIYCPGTPVNYPIVQAEDNDYYLYRLMNGQNNKNGTIFMDFRNQSDFSDWNTLVYGHNMHNNSMFGIVPDYMDQKYYDEHPVWYLLTEDGDYMIELVGGYVTPADSDTYTIPADAAGRDALTKKAATSSSFKSGVKVSGEDKLITLSTCVYDYDNARYVLIGVLREMVAQEDE